MQSLESLESLGSHITQSAEETESWGAQLAPLFKSRDILVLVGSVGAGKTHFVKGLAAGLGCTVSVTSPTFTLIQEYGGGRLPLFHIDFYRLSREKSLATVGVGEYFDRHGLCVVEWGDRFPGLFPGRALWLHFQIVGEQERQIDARGTEIWRHLRGEFGANPGSRRSR